MLFLVGEERKDFSEKVSSGVRVHSEGQRDLQRRTGRDKGQVGGQVRQEVPKSIWAVEGGGAPG